MTSMPSIGMMVPAGVMVNDAWNSSKETGMRLVGMASSIEFNGSSWDGPPLLMLKVSSPSLFGLGLLFGPGFRQVPTRLEAMRLRGGELSRSRGRP